MLVDASWTGSGLQVAVSFPAPAVLLDALFLPALALGPLLLLLLPAKPILTRLPFTLLSQLPGAAILFLALLPGAPLLSLLLAAPVLLRALFFPSLLLRPLLLLPPLDAVDFLPSLLRLSTFRLFLLPHPLLLALSLLMLLTFALLLLAGSRSAVGILLLTPPPVRLRAGPRLPWLRLLLLLRLLGLAFSVVVILRIAGSGDSEKHQQDRCSRYPLSDVHGYCLHNQIRCGRKGARGPLRMDACFSQLCFAAGVSTSGGRESTAQKPAIQIAQWSRVPLSRLCHYHWFQKVLLRHCEFFFKG